MSIGALGLFNPRPLQMSHGGLPWAAIIVVIQAFAKRKIETLPIITIVVVGFLILNKLQNRQGLSLINEQKEVGRN